MRWPWLVWLPAVGCVLAPGCEDAPDDDDGCELTIVDDLPDGRIQLPYEAQLATPDAVADPVWELVAGELPPGLFWDQAGALDGVPEASGSYDFTMVASDGICEGTAELRITVPDVVLISGFEPFGGYDTNPSWDALLPLHEQFVADLDVRTVELPVEWDVSWDLLLDEIGFLAPTVVIGTGMADTDAMRFEVRAQNLQNYTDNAGVTKWNEPIVEDGPSELETGLPVEEMAAAMEEGGYGTTVSSDAGTYLCNHIFFHLTHYELLEADDPPLTGFIHVPPAPYSGTFEVEHVTAAHELGLEALSAWLQGDRAVRPTAPATDAAPTYLRSLP